MSVQQSLSGTHEKSPYRSIVKDAYSTRDDGDEEETQLEIAAWVVMESEGERVIKDESGNLRYNDLLDLALGKVSQPGVDATTAADLAERTELKSYADEKGGRAASTIRGYSSNPERLAPKSEGGMPSSHPVKRVLRRWARSNDVGHFSNDESTEQQPEETATPIEMAKLFAAYRLARSIASQEGFVFAPRSGDPVAVEDNERLDYDEIRVADRPMGDTKASVLLTKPTGQTYEYRVDMDAKKLVRADGNSMPPGGW